ncbi:hypothetical protein FRB95_002647 [Tulasnella sp. JGI-2019a]|nr:hypothetical protein FRB95_002647 [Tulasnella sp. JGI-2019a]
MSTDADTSKFVIQSFQLLEIYSPVLAIRTGTPYLDCPIYRLPEEIILRILLLVLGDTQTLERYKRLGELMLVCSYWESLSDTPSLWAHVSSYQPLSSMKRSLSKSKDAPLDVVYTSYVSEPQSQWSERMEKDGVFQANVHRWKYFEFRGSSWHPHSMEATALDISFMDSLRHLTPSKLESISLHSPTFISFEQLFTAKTELLRHISIERCGIPWDSGLFVGLATLILHNLDMDGPSLNQLIAFLQASPRLVKLSMEDLHPEIDQPLHPNSTHPITLQLLETFNIWHVDPHCSDYLLSRLHIPKCNTFHLAQHDCRLEGIAFSPATEHLFLILRSITVSCDNTHVELYERGLFVTSGKRGKAALKIEWSTDSTLEAWPIDKVQELFELAIAASSIHLTVHTDIKRGSLSKLLRVMENCPSVEKLTLVQHGRDFDLYAPNEVDGILELLSKPPVVDDASQWLLLGIKILVMIQHTLMTQEKLVNMIRHRYADRELRETYKLPVMLQTLRIEGMSGINPYQLETMETILGPGVLEYTAPEPLPMLRSYDSDEVEDDR